MYNKCLVLIFLLYQTPFLHGKFEGKIINGFSVDIHFFPFMASIQIEGNHICGGAIVSNKVIVTAAHCNVYPAEFYSVRIGSSYYNKDGQLVNVSKAISHPKYVRRSGDFDIALLILNRTIDFTKAHGAIAPVKLPTAKTIISTGLPVTVLGWGTINKTDENHASERLQSAYLRTINTTDCVKMFPPHSISEQMVCAQNFGMAQDACTGDSGGPMVGLGVLLGVISWGLGCADSQYPGVYTSVPKVVDFINERL